MLTSSHERPVRCTRDERGAIVVITALLTCFVLLVVGALTVDIGNTWARRGQLQTQADNAAIFAANYLPATTTSSRLVAAKAAVHYIACNPVAGESAAVNPTYPIPRTASGALSCPSRSFDPTQTTYDTAATTLISNGTISFPNRNEIAVKTPTAKVQYGFANVVGARSSLQSKAATAHVYSPGNLVPMGGSLGCIAAAANSTTTLGLGDQLSKLVPINYFSAGSGANTLSGSSGGAATGVTWPAAMPIGAVAPARLVLNTATLITGTSNLSVGYTLDNGLSGLLASILAGLTTNILTSGVKVWFGRGTTSATASSGPLGVLGTGTVTIPASVLSTPGVWHVKVESKMYTSVTTAVQRTSTNDLTINIGASGLSDLASLDNFLSCAKPIVSPRTPSTSASQDMIDNIRRGMDHSLTANPSLVTVAQGLTNLATTPLNTFVTNSLNDPTKLALGCGAASTDVKDTSANAARGPNCVAVDTTKSWAYEFTQGFLTPQGRLSCAVSTCGHGTFSAAAYGQSGTYNDDKITDFITSTNKQTVLDDLLFTSLDTLVTPSIPVLTPANNLSSDIYSSPRFFWAPVLTTAFTTQTNANYPVLTFRPAFITQENPSTTATQKLLDSLKIELSVELSVIINGGITSALIGGVLTLLSNVSTNLNLATTVAGIMSALGNTTNVEDHGLVFDNASTTPANSRLKAVRVMNLNPGSLPAVDPNYSGPVSDYFGSGPKVIRLVK